MEKAAHCASENGEAVFRFPHNPGCCWHRLTFPEGRNRSIAEVECMLLADFAGFGVEADQQLVGQGDADYLGRLAGGAQPLAEGDEVGLITAHHAGHDEQDLAHTEARPPRTARLP